MGGGYEVSDLENYFDGLKTRRLKVRVVSVDAIRAAARDSKNRISVPGSGGAGPEITWKTSMIVAMNSSLLKETVSAGITVIEARSLT